MQLIHALTVLQVSLADNHVSKVLKANLGMRKGTPSLCTNVNCAFCTPKKSQGIFITTSSAEANHPSDFHGFFYGISSPPYLQKPMATLHEESSLKLHLGAHLLKSSCGDLWRETVKPSTDQLKHRLFQNTLITNAPTTKSSLESCCTHLTLVILFNQEVSKHCRSNCPKTIIARWSQQQQLRIIIMFFLF